MTKRWRVDETYIKVKGRWMYVGRAVDSRGQTIDFNLHLLIFVSLQRNIAGIAASTPRRRLPETILADAG